MHTLRGSEWRRWDLHIHTPYTKKNDCFYGSTPEEKWDNFYEAISTYIGDGGEIEKSVCALGITDYLSIDNYLKVKNDGRLPESVKLILPNVEMRIIPIARQSPVNIHCIFDPAIDNQIESRFLSKLKFYANERHYGASRGELIQLGKDTTPDKILNDDDAYKVGIEKYVLPLDALIDVFNNDVQLRDKTIVALSNSSNDGVSGAREHEAYLIGSGSQLVTVCQTMYQFCDAIFSAKPSDIKYFLGEGNDSPEIVMQKCRSLKPCIHGCDAHQLEKIFEPDKQRYCWIKSDPTFEGLKQILVEPKDRVKIQPTIPEIKHHYNVIDRVQIYNDENFSEQPIYLSPNLTCIIGGKSTGKSLLLHNIALAIDPQQVENKNKISASNVKRVGNIRVYWKDGHVSDGTESTDRKIVYIPQAYLNRLSDERETTTEIDKIIEDIVLQNQIAEYAYKNSISEISEFKKTLAKAIMDYCSCKTKIKQLSAERLDIGMPESIRKEINRLNIEFDALSRDSNITDDELQRYQRAVEGARSSSTALLDIQNEIERLKTVEISIDSSELKLEALSIYRDQVTAIITQIETQAQSQWHRQREQLEIQMLNDINNAVLEKQKCESIIDELKPKIDGNLRVSTLSKQIVAENQKYNHSIELSASIDELIKKENSLLNLLTHSFEKFKELHQIYSDRVNDDIKIHAQDLDFSLEVVFKCSLFNEKLRDTLNIRSFAHFPILKNENLAEELITESFLKSLIESISSDSAESLQLKGGCTLESALREVFDDWYTIKYIVQMDNDPIGMMSPGKKALVLLRLLISLAESQNPILLDQPEDDLDNRSIFDELISFIKEKKFIVKLLL